MFYEFPVFLNERKVYTNLYFLVKHVRFLSQLKLGYPSLCLNDDYLLLLTLKCLTVDFYREFKSF